jgi:hypothetical protein
VTDGNERGRQREGTGPGERGRRRGDEFGRVDEASTDTRRRRELYGAALERADGPEDLPKPLVREQVDWMRDVEARAEAAGVLDGPHAVRAHLDVDARKLDDRLDAEPTMSHATAFRSAEALVMAEARAWRDRPREPNRVVTERTNHTLPAKEALGAGWRDHLHGRSRSCSERIDTRFPDDTEIFVLWRRATNGEWQVQTCYPKIPKRRGERS